MGNNVQARCVSQNGRFGGPPQDRLENQSDSDAISRYIGQSFTCRKLGQHNFHLACHNIGAATVAPASMPLQVDLSDLNGNTMYPN